MRRLPGPVGRSYSVSTVACVGLRTAAMKVWEGFANAPVGACCEDCGGAI
jgi:hypothetical protein